MAATLHPIGIQCEGVELSRTNPETYEIEYFKIFVSTF